jgi:uncharacterized protein YegL
VAALCALALSLVLHGVLLSRLPSMLVGHLLESPAYPDYPAIAMGEVQPEPPEPFHPAARFRPENPAEIAEVWGGAEVLAAMAAANLPIPEGPELSTGPVKGEAESLAEPPHPDQPAAWDPRQEVLQIERPQLDEREAALPRRYAASTPRTDHVPDITLPVEQPMDLTSGLMGGLPPGIESLSRPMVAGPGLPEAAGGAQLPDHFSPGAMPTERPPLQDTAPLESERDVEPVEQYLQVTTRVFRATDEPEFLYFELQITRRSETALPVLPKDVLLVQDCSESMTPWKLAECKRGLIRWLDQLNPGDRFDLLAFRDTTTRCFGHWQPFTSAHKATALAFIDGLRAQGNTDVLASLQEALSAVSENGRPVLMALITDGRPTTGVTESSAIIEGFTSSNQGRISVFGLGGGQRVNRFLLDLLSYRNRGDSLVVEESEKIPYAMERWGEETRRPVLSDLSYQFSGIEQESIYPATLTHLYLDRPLTLYGRAPVNHPPAAFQIVGRSGGQIRDMVFSLDLDGASRGDESLRRRWVWHRVYEWIGSYLREPNEAQRSAIQQLADRYGLVVPYGFGQAMPRW